MFRKSILGSILAACLMLAPTLARGSGGNAGTGNIDVQVVVPAFAEWVAGSAISLPDLASVAGTPSNTENLTLYTNVDVDITASSDSTGNRNDGVLTCGAYTLTTSYSLVESGGNVNLAGSTSLLGTTAFLDVTNVYALTHAAGLGVYTLVLTVQAAAPSVAAPDAGTYECGVTLTATWS